jgi:uncharacterized protein YprB with RNaseH-like and TPR domain
MDLSSRLRAIVKGGPPRSTRELTYEPDDGYRQAAVLDLDRVASVLGGRRVATAFGECLVIDRRYESDRWHGGIRVGDCELADFACLSILDPALVPASWGQTPPVWGQTPCGDPASPAQAAVVFGTNDAEHDPQASADWGQTPIRRGQTPRTIFLDLETTGLSGGAGMVAFLVGCGYFDLGAFQVRQFLLTSHSGERALLAACAEFFADAGLIVTYNGKTFDVPVMETRWLFHRMEPSLDGVPHFDMLHPARRLWRHDEQGCRLATLERTLFDVQRVGDVPGMEIPSRFFRFVRSGDPCPLEPVLEHNRIDLVSLAALTAHAVRLVKEGTSRCRDGAEALALGKLYERAGYVDRARTCFEHAASDRDVHIDVTAEALYLKARRLRRERRFDDAAAVWRTILDLRPPRFGRRSELLRPLRQVAAEALAVHHEHRERDYAGAKELALLLLEESGQGRFRPKVDATRHRLARLERKLSAGAAPLLD